MVTAVTTPEWRRFVDACLAMEPGTENSGTAGTAKPGYHNSREVLLANPAWHNDYSIRLPDDQLGPSDAGAAFDWTFHDAQNGHYTTILKYMDRIEAAYHARDPRLHGWREVLGQADPDLDAEGFDFVGWYTRTPDDSHLWHIHFSKLRRYTADWPTFDAMLSILRGESLAQWQGETMGELNSYDDAAKMLAVGFTPAGYLPKGDVQHWVYEQGNYIANVRKEMAAGFQEVAAAIAALAQHAGIPPDALATIDGAATRLATASTAIEAAAQAFPNRDERVQEAFEGAQKAEDN